jgi:hypothetical protein
MSNRIVVAIFMLFLVLMISLYLGSQKYNGFALTKSSLSEYPYEGFAVYQEAFDKREGAANMGEKKKSKQQTAKPMTATEVRNTLGLNTQPVSAFPTYTPDFHSSNNIFLTQPSQPTVDLSLNTQPSTSSGGFGGLFKKKEGFETLTGSKPDKLSGSSYVAEQKPVAFLYNNDANTTCKNYGYTNSKGFICMSSSDIQLLTTRGGNAAGVSDQIGK